MFSGSCNCGAVRFELHGETQKFMLCHCSRCRKGTGSAHASNLFIKGELTWLSGSEQRTEYQIPNARHTKAFCKVCGCGLPFERGEMVVVPAGCLDTELEAKPMAHIFNSSRANWDHDLHQVPGFDQYPE